MIKNRNIHCHKITDFFIYFIVLTIIIVAVWNVNSITQRVSILVAYYFHFLVMIPYYLSSFHFLAAPERRHITSGESRQARTSIASLCSDGRRRHETHQLNNRHQEVVQKTYNMFSSHLRFHTAPAMEWKNLRHYFTFKMHTIRNGNIITLNKLLLIKEVN